MCYFLTLNLDIGRRQGHLITLSRRWVMCVFLLNYVLWTFLRGPLYLKLRCSGVKLMIRTTHTNQCDVIRECVSVCKREREWKKRREGRRSLQKAISLWDQYNVYLNNLSTLLHILQHLYCSRQPASLHLLLQFGPTHSDILHKSNHSTYIKGLRLKYLIRNAFSDLRDLLYKRI